MNVPTIKVKHAGDNTCKTQPVYTFRYTAVM